MLKWRYFIEQETVRKQHRHNSLWGMYSLTAAFVHFNRFIDLTIYSHTNPYNVACSRLWFLAPCVCTRLLFSSRVNLWLKIIFRFAKNIFLCISVEGTRKSTRMIGSSLERFFLGFASRKPLLLIRFLNNVIESAK